MVESDRLIDPLYGRALPALAKAIRQSASAAAGMWERSVRSVLPNAHGLTRQQVLNSLPEVLESLAVALEIPREHDAPLGRLGAVHGRVRFDQDYNLNELLIEYSLLRGVLFSLVPRRLGRSLESEELEALSGALDAVARQAVLDFAAHQQEQMRSVAEAQSKYLSFLSHDLRGGLNGVLLMIEVLRRDLASQPQFASSLQDLDLMRRSILETVGTMDRFLHAERFRQGKVPLRLAQVNLSALSQEVTGQFAYHAKDKGVELEVDLSAGGQLVSDKSLIVLILQNLLGNAIKYSRRGRVAVSASTAKLPQGIACRISVSDEGPGLSTDRLEELFRPFARGETHGQPGTGLGLTIARQAADILGARLWAESVVGQGSTFHLDLPATPPEHR